jgi:hypothetical protein
MDPPFLAKIKGVIAELPVKAYGPWSGDTNVVTGDEIGLPMAQY